MPKAKQITLWTENRPGRLAEVATALGKEKVNIRALWGGFDGDRCAIRLILDRFEHGKKVLAELGWEITEEEVVAIALPHKPGSLGSAARKLEAAALNVEYAYTGPAKQPGTIYAFLAVTDVEAALKALQPTGTISHKQKRDRIKSAAAGASGGHI